METHLASKECQRYLKRSQKETNKCPHCQKYLTAKYMKTHIATAHKNINISDNCHNTTNNKTNNFHNIGDVNDNKIIINDNKIINNNIILNFPHETDKYSAYLFMSLIGIKADELLIIFLEKTNVNVDTPQYHNIICPVNDGEVYQNNQWIQYHIDDITEMIIEQFIKFVNGLMNNSPKNKEIEKIMIPFENAVKNLTDKKQRRRTKNNISEVLSRNTALLRETRRNYQGWKNSSIPSTKNNNVYCHKLLVNKLSKKHTSSSDSSYDSLDDISFDVDDTFYVDDVVTVQ